MQTGVGFFQWLLSLFAANGGGSQTSPTNPNPNSPGGPPAPPPAGASGGGPPGVTHGAQSVLATDWNGKDGSPWAGVQGPSASQQFAQMVENGINTLDQAVAGTASGVSGGATDRLRAYLYGPQATMNHQGPAYQAGQVVGTAIGFVTMFANPCTMGAAAGGSLRALNGIQAGQSLYDAGQKAQAGDYAGAAEDVVDAAFSLMDVFGACFGAGTPILTPEGPKAIEEFRPGDLVLSRHDEEPEGPVEVRVVEDVFERLAEIWELRVGGRSIRTTAEHPFWVEEKGWTSAAELVEGDRLASLDGGWAVVEWVTSSGVLETVYNMSVAEYHTYFVEGLGWGFSVWSHNAKGPCSVAKPRIKAAPKVVPKAAPKATPAPDSGKKTISNVPDSGFVPNPGVSKPYSRPTGAGPTAAQTRAVQGKPCVECGKITPKQVADHKDPLVVQHFRDGAVDVAQQSQVGAVQPHCPDCSRLQGGLLSAFSKRMKSLLGL